MVLAITFSFSVAWPDQEAVNFDRTLAESGTLPALRCPLIITPRDNAVISVTLTNTHVRDTTLRVRSRIAMGSMSFFREDLQQLALQPDQQETLSWPIAIEDAVYNRMVMARVYQFRRTPFPARERACGVMVARIDWLTGRQVVALWIVAAGLALGAGGFLWLRHARPLSVKRRATVQRAAALLLLVLLSIFAGLLQWSIIALLLLVMATIVIGSLAEQLR